MTEEQKSKVDELVRIAKVKRDVMLHKRVLFDDARAEHDEAQEASVNASTALSEFIDSLIRTKPAEDDSGR